MNIQLQDAIEWYIENPRDYERNFTLGLEYKKEGQKAAAMSLFLRTAELTEDKNLQYECLLLNYLMILSQSRRNYSATGQLLHAIAVLPKRPEAYYLFSKYYETQGEWYDMYTYANLALTFAYGTHTPLRTEVGYDGIPSILFQKAVAGWKIGQCDEARALFREILDEYYVSGEMTNLCRGNLMNIGGKLHVHTTYSEEQHDQLRYPFKGSKNIRHNYSQAYQDMFVLSVLDGKKQGTYLEIGAKNPITGNNTALLEKVYNWTGVSIEDAPELVQKYNKERKNRSISLDTMAIDYKTLLAERNMPSEIDYLQLSCDFADVNYATLQRLPFDSYKFAVVTYKHDHYVDMTGKQRDKARRLLKKQGYILLVSDISPDKNTSYEDWWVHPDLVSAETIENMKITGSRTKRAEDYMLGRL